MSTVTWTPDRALPRRWSKLVDWADRNPLQAFAALAALTYGTAAWVFASGVFLLQPTQDIWQHLAAVRALMADPWNPQNPFVASAEGSRHFHPQWLLTALAGRALSFSPEQAIGLAGYINAAVLSAGIYVFGRSFYRHRWGPFALLSAMVFGWMVPVHYTGFHSWTAFAKGGGYPAMLLIGLSFLQWGLVIRSVEGQRKAILWLAPLTALMFATHQLGTVVGLILSGCLLLLWPKGDRFPRVLTGISIVVGLAVSALWPYHNPFDAVLRNGNATWVGSHNFYTLHYLTASLEPSIVGVLGIWWTRAGSGRALGLALIAYLAGFAMVSFGVLIGERFLMPAVLMLQIGMGTVLIRWFSGPLRTWGVPIISFVGVVALISLFHAMNMARFTRDALNLSERGETVALEAAQITDDIPDNEEVAAYDVAAWPLVATGQRVLSVPWPEPMISDLAERRARTNALFGYHDRDDRLRLARAAGVRTLILDERYAWERGPNPLLVQQLTSQAVAVRKRGPLIRFDLTPR